MKKYGIVFAGLAVGLLIILFFIFKSNKSGEGVAQKGQVYFKFAKLPQGIIAKSGSFEVKKEEVLKSPQMNGFEEKRNDLEFVLIYQQFVTRSPKVIKNMYLKSPKVSRSISSLLNQYGVPLKSQTQVHFKSQNIGEGIARVDDKIIFQKDIDRNNFIWASFETELFQYKLAMIDKLLKRKVMSAEAKKLKITNDEFKEEHVYKKLIKKISQSDIQSYMKTYSMEETDFNKKSAHDQLLNLRKNRALDYILEKYLIHFPVKVDLKEPKFSLEKRAEWVPELGSGKKIEISFFGDTRSPMSENLLKELFPLLEKYPQVKFYYRPIFLSSNKLQMTITQAHLCVWGEYPDQFWNFFKQTLGSMEKQTEKRLYKVLDQLKLDVDPIRQCLIKQTMKPAVEYHTNYAHHLGIHLGPVVYIGGEVLHGRIFIKDIKTIIDRQLEKPTAGVWNKDL